MIRISMGVIADVIRMLHQFDKYSAAQTNGVSSMSVVSSISLNDALEIAEEYGYISATSNLIHVTEKGHGILAGYKNGALSIAAMRQILKDYIETQTPLWAYRIPSGRREARLFMSADEIACFEAGRLLGERATIEVVRWWDNLADGFRNDKDKKLSAVGRKGEVLTCEYEYLRTGVEPIWESIESNASGYDVKSSVSECNKESLFIEVKASTQNFENAKLFVSANEWAVAKSHPEHSKFYLWILAKTKSLAVLDTSAIGKNIPADRGEGAWESVAVPFSACCEKSDFQEINSNDYAMTWID